MKRNHLVLPYFVMLFLTFGLRAGAQPCSPPSGFSCTVPAPTLDPITVSWIGPTQVTLDLGGGCCVTFCYFWRTYCCQFHVNPSGIGFYTYCNCLSCPSPPPPLRHAYDTFVSEEFFSGGPCSNPTAAAVAIETFLKNSAQTNVPGFLSPCGANYEPLHCTQHIPLCWKRYPFYDGANNILGYNYQFCSSTAYCLLDYDLCVVDGVTEASNFTETPINGDACDALPVPPGVVQDGACYEYTCGENPNW
jgi:hypothetical protein